MSADKIYQRITRSRRIESEDVLSDISGKLTMISDKLSTLNSTMEDMCQQNKTLIDELRNKSRPTSSIPTVEQEETVSANFVSTTTKLEEAVSKLVDLVQVQPQVGTQMNEFVTIQLEREARIIREQMTETWNKSLNKRKMEYYQATWENSIADMYSTWIKEDPPLIPNKFKAKPVENETEGERQIKVSLSKEKIKSDVEIRRLRAKRHTTNFTDLDERMSEEIRKYTKGAILTMLHKMWEEDCGKEERKSIQIMENKKNSYEQKVREMQEDHDQGRPNIYMNEEDSNRQNNRSEWQVPRYNQPRPNQYGQRPTKPRQTGNRPYRPAAQISRPNPRPSNVENKGAYVSSYGYNGARPPWPYRPTPTRNRYEVLGQQQQNSYRPTEQPTNESDYDIDSDEEFPFLERQPPKNGEMSGLPQRNTRAQNLGKEEHRQDRFNGFQRQNGDPDQQQRYNTQNSQRNHTYRNQRY